MGGCSKESSDEQAVRDSIGEHVLDALIIKYFRVLPTDPRFKQLTTNQKLWIFYSFQECLTLEDYQEHARRNPKIPSLTKEDLLQADMNEEDAEWYAKQISAVREGSE